jgi:hypothetical protein
MQLLTIVARLLYLGFQLISFFRYRLSEINISMSPGLLLLNITLIGCRIWFLNSSTTCLTDNPLLYPQLSNFDFLVLDIIFKTL